MEEWEQAIDTYPQVPEVRVFIKVLKTAEVVFKQDLAPFELDWITSTLFFKPVLLFETISSKRNDPGWSKPISDAFKLIGDVVAKSQLEHLFENIVTLCFLSYTPQIRKDALSCLAQVARVSAEGARDAARLVNELEDSSTCKTQLAVLVGVIAEHHPELVTDSAPRIWRIYLNLLESNKNTDTVINSVLQGLLGLFKHFGADLPIAEFRDLYEKMARVYLLKGKCEDVCLSILQHHANLFKELLASDPVLRQKLWALQSTAALLAVYETIATTLRDEQMEKILSSEVIPRTHSNNSRLKYTALRILTRVKIPSTSTSASAGTIMSTSMSASDCSSLGHELKHGSVSLDKADAILWCIESSALGSVKLLQTAVLFFHNIPTSKRRDIVVHGLLNASEDVRTATVALLINESTSQPIDESIDKYLPLWKDLFDSKKGTDSVVLSKSKLVFKDYMEYVFMVVEAAIEEDLQQVPDKLTSLLTLTYHVLSNHPHEDYTETTCYRFLPLLERLAVHSSVLSAATAAADHVEHGLDIFCKAIRVDKCQDEALLCESCYMLIHATEDDHVDVDNVLMAIEILLTRTDVEPKTLIQAIHSLEAIINNDQINLDPKKLDRMLSLVHNLRSRKSLKGKEERILHRDVIVFMGKYGNNKYLSNQSSDVDNSIVADLKDKLHLSISNPIDGISYKLNLQRLLQLATINEDADVLQKLLPVICASLSSNKDPSLQLSLTLVIRSLCRAHTHCATVDASSIQQAVLLCDSEPCLTALLRYISEEKSPGVRKMLSDALESLLLTNPTSESTEQLVKVTAQRACVMMASGEATIRSGGLSITETLLSALKDNHLLQTKELPTILKLILETEDLDANNTFKIAYKMFIENLELYNEEKRQNIIEILAKNITKSKTDMSKDIFVKIFKNKVLVTLDFFRNVPNFDCQNVFSMINMGESFEKAIYFIAKANLCIKEDDLEKILNMLSTMETKSENIIFYEAVLKFFVVYKASLYNKFKEATLNVMKNIIRDIPPKYVIQIRKQIKSCMNSYFCIKDPYEDIIFEEWYKKHDMKDFIDKIKNMKLCTEYAEPIKAMRIYLEIFHVSSKVTSDLLNLNDTVLKIYTEMGEQYIDIFKNYLSDILHMSRYNSNEELRLHIVNSYEKTGFNYLRYFMDVYYSEFLEEPYILLSDDMRTICLVLNDILKSASKKNITLGDSEKVLKLIDAIWPTYNLHSTFEDKCSLLLGITRLPIQLSCGSAPMKWALGEVVKEGEGRERLIEVLPGGDECSAAYKQLASRLPARLSELSGVNQYVFQAVLEAIAVTADATLIDIVVRMANCDQSKGWWDEEIASCMASLARRGDCSLTRLRPIEDDVPITDKKKVCLMSIANMLFDDPSVYVCKRLLVPLLRYSTPSFCESFFSAILDILLLTLAKTVRSDRDTYELRKTLKQHAKAYTLITVAFEKIPLASLKSAESALYSRVEGARGSSGFLMRRASALCVASRAKPCPKDAGDELKECYRQFQTANYKCICAAVSITRPDAKFYRLLFCPKTWGVLFSQEKWDLPLRTQWTQQKTVHTVASAPTAAASSASTTRSRVFLRTLSENPLQFDLMDVGEEPAVSENSHEVELVDNELNSQECADTVTALIRHACTLPHTEWVTKLAAGLSGTSTMPIAQMICNCREPLTPHAAALRGPLLEVAGSTFREDNGRKLVNSLHVDILETLLHWKDPSPSPSEHLNSTIECLINTIIDNNNYVSLQSWLIGLLNRVLEVYGKVVSVPWRCFESYFTAREQQKTVLKILLGLTKHKILIPELIPTLTSLDERSWLEPKLAELFGQTLACEREIERPVAKYRQFMDRKRQRDDVDGYVKLLYYAQMGYPKICDEYHFKMILQLTSRVVGHTKSKCLRIVSSYIALTDQTDLLSNLDVCSLLREFPLETMKLVTDARTLITGRIGRQIVAVVVPYVSNSDSKVRAQAVSVVLNAFEDLFNPTCGEPSAKRSKPNTSKLLRSYESPDTYTSSVITSIAKAVTDSDVTIARNAREKVAACLNNDDMKIRLAESFLVSISMASSLNRSASACMSCFLDLLLCGLRANDRFRQVKLREEPLELSDLSSSKLLTNTRTYQGTFLSTAGRRRVKSDQTSSGINVQIPIDDILGSILQFAQDKPESSRAFSKAVIRAILASSPGFDATASLARLARDALDAPTPIGVDLARLVVTDEFGPTIDKLLQATQCTEGEDLVQLLYEEYLLKTDEDMFELGRVFIENDEMDTDTSTPTFEDIISAFGKLSNWDNLTVQQRNEAQSTLPQLWVEQNILKTWLEEENVISSKSWLHKMLSAYRDECKRDSLRWLSETDRWPRRHFDVSVVTELIESTESSDHELKTRCDIRPTDCLVEWAVRLMIRKAFAPEKDSDTSDMSSASYSHELTWCKIANDRGLPHLAINCYDVNNGYAEDEQHLWKIEKARALRIIGLKNNDTSMLGDALSALELIEDDSNYYENCYILLHRLMTALNIELGSLRDSQLEDIMISVNIAAQQINHRKIDKLNLSAFYELAITYYDDIWSGDTTDRNDMLNKMADILGHMIELDLTQRAEMFLSVLFNRLDEFLSDAASEISENTGRNILEKISLLPLIDDIFLDRLKVHSHRFDDILAEFPTISAIVSENEEEVWKRQFQLVCDVKFSVLRRSEALLKEVDDRTKWKKSFELLKYNIFDNPYATESTECNVLSKYKHDLYVIEDFDSSTKEQKTSTLKKILADLYKKCAPRATLRLSQLCPALAKYSYSGSEGDAHMSRLLGLGKLGVVKFYEQVSVFLDAVTRPVVLSVLLTNGTIRRYIHKNGDRLKVDQSAQRVALCVKHLVGGAVLGYTVTPLGEDSGLIEFVENSTRLRDMINSVYDLDQVDIGARAADDELVLSSASMEHHRTFCKHVPPQALRSAIEASCSSTEDFINKKKKFMETLSTLTLLCWLFGLGDRHLENILYSERDGSVWCVDWAAMFVFGEKELCPARLTRNIVGVVDPKVLEARIQSQLSALRDSQKLFLNVIRCYFKWMDEEFDTKYPNIQQYATGKATSYQVTRRTVQASVRPYKERIVKVLDEAFSDLEDKEQYSVVEQVTCLLRQCTDARILSITRSGWEPWI